MEIELQELKEGLKEKGLTQNELDLLGDNLLERYTSELKEEMQTFLEHNIDSIVEDIKTEYLVSTPWIVIIQDNNAHVGTGYTIDKIIVGPGEDIIKKIHDMYDTLTADGKQGNTILPMRLDYAEDFSEAFGKVQQGINLVLYPPVRTSSKYGYDNVKAIDVDYEMREDDDDEEATSRIHIGR